MGRRLLRGTVRIGVVVGVVGTVAFVARRLLGRGGPVPEVGGPPKAWPPLVPDPAGGAGD